MDYHSDHHEQSTRGAFEQHAAEGDPDGLGRLLDAVQGSLARERGVSGRLKALTTRMRYAIVAGGTLLLVLCVMAFAPRSDLGGGLDHRSIVAIGVDVVLLAILSGRALQPLQQRDLPRRLELAVALVASLAAWLPALWPGLPLGHLEPADGRRDCLALGLVFGTVLMVLLRTLDRSPASGRTSSVIFAAAGGMAANLALLFHCSDAGRVHLAVVHAPLGLLLWFGSTLLTRLAARRAERHPRR